MVREVGDRGSCLPVEEAMNDSLPAEAVAEEPVELILSPDDSDSDSMDSLFDYISESEDESSPRKEKLNPLLVYSFHPKFQVNNSRDLRRFQEACELSILPEIKDLLVGNSTLIRETLPNKLNALMTAIFAGHFDVAELLLSLGANVNAAVNGTQAIHAVFWRDDVSSEDRRRWLDLLLGHGAYKHAVDPNGYSPFLWAVDKGDVENVKFLLNLGANASRKDAQGRTAFHIACGAGRSSVMKELVARDELVDPELRKARRVEYSQAAKSCLDEVVERAVETLIDGGPFVIPSKIDDKIRKEIVCELPELTGAFQPCGDLRIQNPILKPPVAPGRYISGGMLDIGEQLCRPELGLSFLAGGKTRLKDLLTVTEEDLDDLGIRKIGDRIAYLELPCIALRTDFSGKYLEGRIDRYKSPYGQESIEYLSVALSKAPMDLGKRRKVYSDYVRQAVASTCLPLLEADTRCVALWCSVMAAHHVVASRALKTMQEFEKVDEDKLRMLRQLAKTFATDLNAVMETVEETRFILKRELRINPLIKQVDKLKPRTKRWARFCCT